MGEEGGAVLDCTLLCPSSMMSEAVRRLRLRAHPQPLTWTLGRSCKPPLTKTRTHLHSHRWTSCLSSLFSDDPQHSPVAALPPLTQSHAQTPLHTCAQWVCHSVVQQFHHSALAFFSSSLTHSVSQRVAVALVLLHCTSLRCSERKTESAGRECRQCQLPLPTLCIWRRFPSFCLQVIRCMPSHPSIYCCAFSLTTQCHSIPPSLPVISITILSTSQLLRFPTRRMSVDVLFLCFGTTLHHA